MLNETISNWYFLVCRNCKSMFDLIPLKHIKLEIDQIYSIVHKQDLTMSIETLEKYTRSDFFCFILTQTLF